MSARYTEAFMELGIKFLIVTSLFLLACARAGALELTLSDRSVISSCQPISVCSQEKLLAYGPVSPPQQSAPMPHIRPAETGTQSTPTLPPVQFPTQPGQMPLEELQTPGQQPTNQQPANQQPANQQPGNATAPMAAGSVEYSEDTATATGLPHLHITQALNEALINSPRACAIRAQFGIARAGYAAATEAPNPIFFFDRGMVAEQENRIGPILTEEPLWKLYFRLIAQQRLVAQTKLDLMNQLWQLRANVRRAYTEVVVAQETLTTLNELYELSSRLEFVASKRFQAGDVPELDVLKARLATSQANVDRIVGAQRVIRARQQLNVILGRSVTAPMNVPSLPDYTHGQPKVEEKSEVLPDFKAQMPPLAQFISGAELYRLELKSLQQQLRVNQANLKTAYANVLPNPTIAFGKSTGGNAPTGPKITAVFFTLNVASPTGTFNQGQLFQYKATAKQLHYQMAAQRNQIATDVASAYQNLLASRGKLKIYQEHVLADSYEVARLARRSYEVGQSDITATLAAQQANVQIRSAYLDAVTSYQQSYTDLEQAFGRPLQ